MATSNYNRVVGVVKQVEGGWKAPDPYDKNPTYKGITQATYDRYRQRHGLSTQPVVNISDSEWDDLFRSMFWKLAGGDIWQWPLDLAAVDFGFHSGPKRPIRFLQSIVGVTPDGILGPVTIKAVSEQDPKQLAVRLNGRRVNWWNHLYDAAQAEGAPLPPLIGWQNRMKALQRAMDRA